MSLKHATDTQLKRQSPFKLFRDAVFKCNYRVSDCVLLWWFSSSVWRTAQHRPDLFQNTRRRLLQLEVWAAAEASWICVPLSSEHTRADLRCMTTSTARDTRYCVCVCVCACACMCVCVWRRGRPQSPGDGVSQKLHHKAALLGLAWVRPLLSSSNMSATCSLSHTYTHTHTHTDTYMLICGHTLTTHTHTTHSHTVMHTWLAKNSSSVFW